LSPKTPNRRSAKLNPETLFFNSLIINSLITKVMGTIKQGILGQFSGKVGTVIGSSWKGQGVMRGIAPSVANPKTDGQLAVRQKFSITMKFVQSMVQFLRIGFKNYAMGMTQVNAAFSYNRLNAILGTYPNFTVKNPPSEKVALISAHRAL
jgi:hypothetical protein